MTAGTGDEGQRRDCFLLADPGLAPVAHAAWEHSLQSRELLAAGKRKKVALVACMRKLLTMLNAIAKHGSTWDPTLHHA